MKRYGKLPGIVMGFLAVIAVVSIAGCGQGEPSGTYATKNGMMKFTFGSGGKVDVIIAGISQQGTYSVDDGKVKFADMQGRTAVMTIEDNGCLESQFFGELCKR